mgnify:CR=1 FL=1
MKQKDVKVKVEYTEGYEKRFTEACLKILKRREKQQELLNFSMDDEENEPIEGIV